MAIQLSVAVRNAGLDAYETAIGASPTLEIRTGPQPADCAAADTGTLLASMALPADWMAVAAAGLKSMAGGPWQDPSANADGLAGHFRIKQGVTCHMQGSVGQGSGDLQINNTAIITGQPVVALNFVWGASNA